MGQGALRWVRWVIVWVRWVIVWVRYVHYFATSLLLPMVADDPLGGLGGPYVGCGCVDDDFVTSHTTDSVPSQVARKTPN